MSDARYTRLPTDENSPEANADIETRIDINELRDFQHVNCVSIPYSTFNGMFWEKKVVHVDKDNLVQILLDLEHAEKELEARANNADIAGKMVIRTGVLLIALLQIVKESVNIYEGVPANETNAFNVTMNAICFAIPLVTGFIAEIMTHIKNNAEKFKKDSIMTQEELRPRPPR